MAKKKSVVARADEVPPGGAKAVTVDGREIAIFNIAGEYFAISRRCPHEGGDLSKGIVCGLVESDAPGSYRLSRQGEFLRCPWHGWEFDIRSGRSYCDPRKLRVRNFAVHVEPGKDLADGPYTIETYPISVDAEYLVVEI